MNEKKTFKNATKIVKKKMIKLEKCANTKKDNIKGKTNEPKRGIK